MIDRIIFAATVTLAAGGLLLLVATARAETASWYHEGQRVACGGTFRPDGLTAAHRRLPCGTRVRVTSGGRSVVVTINDRGPWHRNKRTRVYDRDIDLSRGAATVLRKRAAGVFAVTLQVL